MSFLKHFTRLNTKYHSFSLSKHRFPLSIQKPGNQLTSKHFFSSITLKVPPMGDSISEGTITQFQKKVGDFVKIDDIIVVIETDKTSLDVRATDEGVITKLLAKEDDTVEIDSPLIEIDTSKREETVNKEETAAVKEEATIKPTAAVKEEEATTVKPTTEEENNIQNKEKSNNSFLTNNIRSEKRVKLSRMRLKIAQRLKESQNIAASLTNFNEIDCSNLIKMRSELKESFEKKFGVKLGFMSTFVKASTLALLEMPEINAYLEIENKEIVYHDFVDISVAVASPNGLVVPVLRNTEKMTFSDIEKQIIEYGKQAKKGKIALEDMSGGTFTISNSGVFKSMIGTPIINPPQSAVLGLYGIFDRPVVVDKEIVIRPMMKVALTYDHRIVDGREAVLFLRKIKDCVENPLKMLLDI